MRGFVAVLLGFDGGGHIWFSIVCGGLPDGRFVGVVLAEFGPGFSQLGCSIPLLLLRDRQGGPGLWSSSMFFGAISSMFVQWDIRGRYAGGFPVGRNGGNPNWVGMVNRVCMHDRRGVALGEVGYNMLYTTLLGFWVSKLRGKFFSKAGWLK